MTRRSLVWRVLALLYLVVNLGGAVYAAATGELLHAGVHAVLLVAAYPVWRFLRLRDARRSSRPGETETDATAREFTERMTRLEHSVDAIAIEVGRIAEGQRFVTRFVTERGAHQPARERAAEVIEVKAREAAPDEGDDRR